ncbi:MAG: cupin domain-containing protein [Oscillospiraceae bacterium]
MEKFLSMVTPDDVETQILSWGSFQWLNEPRVTGTDNMAVGIGHIKPGDGHTRHNHPGSDEFIYFMQGKAEQTIEREDGFQSQIMNPGDLVFIHDGVYHSTMNVGDTDLVFMAVYQHAGPEVGLREASDKILPPKNAK